MLAEGGVDEDYEEIDPDKMHDHPDGGMVTGDQLIEYLSKLGQVNLKKAENKIYDINKKSVGRPVEEIDKL
eukprot:7154608-Prymnesium_polylepis.1